MGSIGRQSRVVRRLGDPIFLLLFVASYALLLIDPLATSIIRETALPLSLGFLYIIIGTLGFAQVERNNLRSGSVAYFVIQIPLGVTVFLGSGGVIGGTFLLLLAIAQAVRVLPLWWVVVLSAPLPFLHVGMAWPGVLREGATFLAGLIFVITFSRVVVNEQHARAEAQRLASELGAANDKLRDYAAQAEDFATTRERNRIAREIHDGLGHYLTVINMQIQAARAVLDQDRPRAEATLDKAQHLTREALADIRRSVAVLRSAPTEGRTLPDALAGLAEESCSAGVVTELSVQGVPRRLDPQAELVLFRAAQEGLTNVRKHAAAARVELALDYRDPTMASVVVSDDGHGADQIDGGFGILGLRERTQLIGGTVRVQTAPGSGLRLMVEVPG